jgi:hypothetical protein
MVDFLAGDENEVKAILACRHPEKRGRPLGSPDVDWFAAKTKIALGLSADEATPSLFSAAMEANEGAWRTSLAHRISIRSDVASAREGSVLLR